MNSHLSNTIIYKMIEINSKNLTLIILGLACIILFCLGTNAYLFNSLRQKNETISLIQKRLMVVEKGLDVNQTELMLLVQKGNNPARTETAYEISYNSNENQTDGFREIEKDDEVNSILKQWNKKNQEGSITVDIDIPNENIDYKKFRKPEETSRRIKESETRFSDSLDQPVKKKKGRSKK